MQSHEHAAVGAVVSAGGLLVLLPDLALAGSVAAFAYGVGLSVLIDLDHFPVARLVLGDWRHARRVLANPAGLVGDQSWIFADVDGALRGPRLLSHAVLGAVLVAGTWAALPALGAFTAVVLVAHVGCDLLRDADVV